jgi:hypothetical protein
LSASWWKLLMKVVSKLMKVIDESCQQVDVSCWWKLSASWCVRLQIFFMTSGEKHIPKVTIAI